MILNWRKWIIIWAVVRYGGVGLVTLSMLLSIINPILGVFLILTIALVSNLALKLVARPSNASSVLYAGYVGSALTLAGLWGLSVLTGSEALIIFLPIWIGYWIVSRFVK